MTKIDITEPMDRAVIKKTWKWFKPMKRNDRVSKGTNKIFFILLRFGFFSFIYLTMIFKSLMREGVVFPDLKNSFKNKIKLLIFSLKRLGDFFINDLQISILFFIF